MKSPSRYAYRPAKPRPPEISEEEVFARVLTAIKTLKAMPDAERRFLMAGTKSGWVQTMVEWSDLVAQAEQVQDDVDPREVYRPKRSEISDAMIAGEWFARLAVLPWNVEEFEVGLGRYRAGRIKSPQVDDQKILNWYASGWSLKLIGERLKLNEHQAERRLCEIRTALASIANGNARLADTDARRAERKRGQARYVGC